MILAKSTKGITVSKKEQGTHIIESKKPAYIKIAQDLASKIESGEYAEGALLVSERMLGVEYGVSTIVANKALNILAQQGLITKMPRKGSVVSAGKSFKAKPIKKSKKIIINAVHIPKDIQERQAEFCKLLTGKFANIEIEYKYSSFKSAREIEFLPDADIYISFERDIAEFELSSRLLPLDDVVNKINLSDYFPQPFKECKMGTAISAVPINFNASVLYCNERLLKALPFEADLNNLTWDSFLHICKQIKLQKPECFPMGFFDFTSGWWENFFFSFGLSIMKEDRFEVDVFGERGMQAVNVMRQLKRYDLSENLTIRKDTMDLLNNDKVAFLICNPRLLAELADSSKWCFAQIPQGLCASSAGNSFVASINIESQNIKEAKDILSFFLSKKFQLWLGKERGIAPVHKEALLRSYGNSKYQAICEASKTAKMVPNNIEYWCVHQELAKAINNLVHSDVDPKEIELEINNMLYAQCQKWRSAQMFGIS